MAQSQQRKPGSWDNDRWINLYIYDYCVKRNFQNAAAAFASEAQVPLDTKLIYDAPEGFLYEWFVVFWDCWTAAQNQAGATASKDMQLYLEAIKPSASSCDAATK
ncbi:hypothetical protein BGW42_003549 [Actinomortierella wolfii]|nr:hypothetical protein BGW42_003549 [Actinomortierella wolfii]